LNAKQFPLGVFGNSWYFWKMMGSGFFLRETKTTYSPARQARATTMFMTWKCSCGASLELSMEQITSGREQCPKCGCAVRVGPSDDLDPLSSDTQLVNLSDMARMAQEGVETTTSGEWDTKDNESGKP